MMSSKTQSKNKRQVIKLKKKPTMTTTTKVKLKFFQQGIPQSKPVSHVRRQA